MKRAIDAWAFAEATALAERVTNIKTAADAIEFLIDEQMIEEDEARGDV